MTKNELIDMATQSGFSVTHTSNLGVELYLCTPKDIERFANLVAAASEAKEREACAFIGDGYHDDEANCGDAIRARGQA